MRREAIMPDLEPLSDEFRSGPADLVKPLPGVPFSGQQVEEHSGGSSGDSALDVERYAVCRDSMGRLRIERLPLGPDEAPMAYLIDPSTGSKAILSQSDRIAYRTTGPKMGENGFAYGFSGMGKALPPGNWTSSTEELGKRTIDGNEFEGKRITYSADGPPARTNVTEFWYSAELKLTGLAIASGPFGTHMARIQNLRREEPDPALFAIPENYKIEDLEVK